MKKQIAFIGSSGGNLYKQGGNDIAGMMKEILAQTKAADMEIAFVQYVLASGSLDTVGPESKASLYTWDGAAVCKTFEGTLQQVNEKAAEVDAVLAEKVGQGEIDGIMFVSADPQGCSVPDQFPGDYDDIASGIYCHGTFAGLQQDPGLQRSVGCFRYAGRLYSGGCLCDCGQTGIRHG